MAHIVTAALVIAKGEAGDVYLYRGAQVPASIPADEVERLAKGGFLDEVKSEVPSSAKK